MAGKRILVIEDDPSNLRLMLLLLKTAGHTATGVDSGTAGLEAARRERPDLVLCDGCLPDIDGFEVARQLREDAALAGLKLVAVTGLARPGETDRLIEAGFHGFIGKPFDIKTFVSEVGRFLA